MFHNRISQYSDAQSISSPADELHTLSRQLVGATSLVMVPAAAQQVAWQTQLYAIAYQRALADLAPPRHQNRFFSVWN